jgi:hypothetical protein
MGTWMDRFTRAVALVARGHARDGTQLNDAETKDLLRAAGARLGEAYSGVLTAPSTVTQDGVLVLSLTSPEAILDAVLHVASELRPVKTTFCAAVVPREGAAATELTQRLEAAVLAAGTAESEASSRLLDTDPRECRAIVLAEEEDRLASVLIDLLLECYDAMTDRQRQIVSLIRESDTQQEVATHLRISRQAVNQSLAASGWLHLKRAEDSLEFHLAGLAAGSEAESREPAVV